MNMCFDCIYAKIIETSPEWLECHCQKDGRWYNPLNPAVFGECKNFEKREKNDEQI